MFIPTPSLQPLVSFENLSDYLKDLEGMESITGGIGVYGSAAAYALVWELGSLRIKKPGPKTMWGVNRYGKKRIFSKQAPKGYVGVIADDFWPIIENELSKVNFSAGNLHLRLEVAMDNAGQRIAQLVRQYAPVDSGDLRAGIQGVDSDDSSFLGASTSLASQGALIL